MPRLPVAAPASRRRIIQLRAAQELAAIVSARHQHLASGQQRRRVIGSVRCRGCRSPSTSHSPDHTAPRCSRHHCHSYPPATSTLPWAAASPCETACGAEAAGRRSTSPRRIIQLRAAQGDQPLLYPPATSTLPWAAASPCDRRVRCPGCRSPSTSPRRIIQLRAAQDTTAIVSPRHQHLASGQQRRRVKVACGAEAAGRRPRSTSPDHTAPRCSRSRAIVSPRHQHLAGGQQRRRVIGSVRCRGCRSPSTSQSPDHTAPRCSRNQ